MTDDAEEETRDAEDDEIAPLDVVVGTLELKGRELWIEDELLLAKAEEVLSYADKLGRTTEFVADEVEEAAAEEFEVKF